MKDIPRLLLIIAVLGGATAYVYNYHWEDYYPLFGYLIMGVCGIFVLIGIGIMITFLIRARRTSNLKFFAFIKSLIISLGFALGALAVFWISEPLIYKSMVATLQERVIPDWYYQFFDRSRPELEEIILEKESLF